MARPEDPRSAAPSWARSAGLLSVATVVVSAGNYLFSLVAVHLLGPEQFSRFAAAQGLLLVLGTASMAAVPWAVARYLAVQDHPGAAREAMHFGLTASLVQAAVVGPVAGVVLWSVAGPQIGAVTAVCAFLVALTAAPVGFLQGDGQVERIALIRIVELLARSAVGLGLVLVVSRSAANALWGFPAGSLALLVLGLLGSRRGLPVRRPSRETVRTLVRQSVALGLVQVLVSVLAAIDSVVAQGSSFPAAVAGSYQAASLLGRIPLFLGAAVAMAAYTSMARARTEHEVGGHLRRALVLYASVTVPIVVGAWTVPGTLLRLVVPAEYGQTAELLRFTVVSGAAVGLVTVVATAHQARGRFGPALAVLVPAAVAQPALLLLAGRLGSATVFAAVLVAVSVCTATALTADARRWLAAPVARPWPGWLLVGLALLAAFLLHHPVVWTLDLLGATLVTLAKTTGLTGPGPAAGAGPTAEASSAAPGPAAAAETGPPARKYPARKVQPGPDPEGPRVLVTGDSWAGGLGYKEGPGFGRATADLLEPSAVLDLTASGRTVADTLERHTGAIRSFAPQVAVVNMGGTEGLVHPSGGLQTLIERFAPASWHGVAGLEPRARFSENARTRRRQKVESTVKLALKRALIALTGGSPRVPLEEVLAHGERLLGLLDELGTRVTVIGLPHADKTRFPGTDASLQRTNAALADLVAAHPGAIFVPVAEELEYWTDFLADHMHLDGPGHRRVAAVAAAATRARVRR